MSEVFKVVQFFENDTYDVVREWVPAEEAVKAFQHYCNSVAVKMGMVKRVIITDGGDRTVAEWIHGKGLVWPKKVT